MTIESEAILELADLCFGKGFLTQNELSSIEYNPNHHLITFKKDSTIIGFSWVQIHTVESLQNVLLIDSEQIGSLFGMYNSIGYRKLTAVHPSFTNHGVGNDLFERGNAWLMSQNTDAFTVSFWDYPANTSYKNRLLNAGFVPKLDVPNYWNKHSLKKGYSCAICGSPPCRCSAIIFVKPLK